MPLTLPDNTTKLPTRWGEFHIFTIPGDTAETPHAVLVNPVMKETGRPALVCVHSECFTGDILGSLRCDCEEQLHTALGQIAREGGVLVYLRQEGRGSGLTNKLKAYALQDHGLDTVEAQVRLHLPIDSRSYQIAADALQHLGVTHIRLLTNNPQKIKDLSRHGMTVVERVPLGSTPNPHNLSYLETKKNKMGHLLNLNPHVA